MRETRTHWILLRSWILTLKELRFSLPSFIHILSTTLPTLSIHTRRVLPSSITSSHQEPVLGRACNPPDPHDLFLSDRGDSIIIIHNCSFSIVNVGGGFKCLRSFSFLSWLRVSHLYFILLRRIPNLLFETNFLCFRYLRTNNVSGCQHTALSESNLLFETNFLCFRYLRTMCLDVNTQCVWMSTHTMCLDVTTQLSLNHIPDASPNLRCISGLNYSPIVCVDMHKQPPAPLAHPIPSPICDSSPKLVPSS